MTDTTTPNGGDADNLDDLLTAYFAEHDQVDELNRRASQSLFELRRVDDRIADLVTSETAMRNGSDPSEPLRYEVDDITLTVSVSPGVLDVVVQPASADVYLETAEGGTIPIALDAAGGGTVNFVGPARLRVRLDGDRSIVTDPFLIPRNT